MLLRMKKRENKSNMKKIFAIVGAIALVVVGILGTNLFYKMTEPNIQVSATSIQEQLSESSELATAKLEYRGLVRYEEGDIQFINKKAFTMVYDAEVRAGVDLSQAKVEISGKSIVVALPEAELFNISIDPNSLEFYDASYALFNWQNREDTAAALVVAEEDAAGKVDQLQMLEEATSQAHTVVKTLLAPLTEGESGYNLSVVKLP